MGPNGLLDELRQLDAVSGAVHLEATGELRIEVDRRPSTRSSAPSLDDSSMKGSDVRAARHLDVWTALRHESEVTAACGSSRPTPLPFRCGRRGRGLYGRRDRSGDRVAAGHKCVGYMSGHAGTAKSDLGLSRWH